jgi:hypothetical protein
MKTPGHRSGAADVIAARTPVCLFVCLHFVGRNYACMDIQPTFDNPKIAEPPARADGPTAKISQNPQWLWPCALSDVLHRRTNQSATRGEGATHVTLCRVP